MMMFPSSIFSIGNTLFGQIWSKIQGCQFKLKFGASINSNMQNSMFTFFVFDQKTPFWGKFRPKIQNCLF